MELRKITYKDHPYKWATIGQDISHIEKVTLKDAMDFYKQFYAPNNCILSICGDVDYEKTFNMVKKWFADIPPSTISRQQKIQEREQKGPRAEKVEEPVAKEETPKKKKKF